FAPGDVLIRQGEQAADVFLLLDGLVEIDVDGTVVAQAGPGSIIGERAVLEGGRRTSTVRAVSPVKAAVAHPGRLDDEALTEIAGGHRREDD
ncbi:MAG: cyclic nucleotide-binding domain-containing protein, partial [Acidimicrobiia bacterium]|nr:cyclic nucleotide-binding domain-containing protein [Acidimicrobiia bacterium]